MRKKPDREPRESSLASGWTVEADPTDVGAAQGVTAANPDDSVVDPPVDGINGTRNDADQNSATSVVSTEAGDRTQLSNGALVLLGVVGGLYLLYTWVWFSWANYYAQINSAVAEGSGSIGAVLQQTVFWAAPLAPALWFIAAFIMCRGSRTRKLALWLLIGALVLLPLPAFVTVGGA